MHCSENYHKFHTYLYETYVVAVTSEQSLQIAFVVEENWIRELRLFQVRRLRGAKAVE